ncbi:MAG TPA: serine protease [Henriciella marina]|uniref:trypsin-like peptidase domain-containing protein n=1 Tax=Henriciella sp. TaxID=1968823 RepID=UPI0017A66A70|nr:hypothetical protein [Henriciella sp.]HIG21082.1 serine protease [Henriciella sp.]HIK63450.1 serine protease [Henriciella marina]
MIEPVLLTTARVRTFNGQQPLTNASGFFFQRGRRLFLVTSRHVLFDEPADHRPDRVELEFHTDKNDLGQSTGFSIPLYQGGRNSWLELSDGAGMVDIVAIEIDASALPKTVVMSAFTREDIVASDEPLEIGSTFLILGYPLGFDDALHHLPVARQATLASSFGLRFGGEGYFLADARTHRGISGAPVIMRKAGAGKNDAGRWRLVGVHSARLEASSRDPVHDEALSLNSIWYADALNTLIS